MEKNYNNKNQEIHQNDAFWNAVETPFTESKEEIWTQLEAKIDFDIAKPKTIKLNWVKYSAAAVFILLLSTTFFARFYTETISTAYGETVNHILPDGSQVKMNVNSKLSYNPYWFNINRQLNFEGEAFFEVEKGKHFIANSKKGSTEVLGTSFNIFTRENEYRVFCKTGLVKVSQVATGKSQLLNPNQIAFIEKDKLNFIGKAEETKEVAWQYGNFNFESVALEKVLKTFEQEYKIKINSNFQYKKIYIYTGFFKKQKNAYDALETVCLSLDLKLEQVNENEFVILNAE